MFDCIMLAAGASSRMRSLRMRSPEGVQAFKPLLPFAGSTLMETAAAAALGASCRLILVVGCRGDEIAALFDSPRYRDLLKAGRILIVENPRWAEGMVGSVQATLPEIEGDAFFIAHADMPFVRAEDYHALDAAWAEVAAAGGDAAVIASHGGRGGHPVLLPSAWIPEIIGLPDGERLKPFLSGKSCVRVETGPGALRDIDTPEGYALALKACKRRETR
jgi:CTP:molybdopterin cytidylyltransferase MocA